MARRATVAVLGAGMIAGLLALSAPALARRASGNRVTVKAPATVAPGFGFMVRVSGFASRPADTLVLFKASAKVRCPNTYKRALGVANSVGSLLLHPGKHGRRFSFKTGFMATTAGVNYICAYVVYRFKTYAHTGVHYTVP
jgi:hypothetical protein